MSKRDTILIPDKETSRNGGGRVAAHFRGTPERDELIELDAAAAVQRAAKEADAWMRGRGWTRTQFCEQFSNLCGDRKTFGQFADNEPATWDRRPELWLDRYLSLPGALREYDLREEETGLLTLPHVVTFTDALKDLRATTGLRRALLIDGVGGSGKTSLLKMLANTLGDARMVKVRGRQSWASFGMALRHWLEALGVPVPDTKRPPSCAALQEKVAEALRKAGDVVVTVDELHRACPQLINALTDWITDAAEAKNRVHFVLAAEPSLWDSLTGHYKAEAKQLTWNRVSDRISLEPPGPAECLLLLAQRVKLEVLGDDREAAGVMLARHAANHGGRALVCDVRRNAAKLGAALTFKELEKLAKAVAHKNR